MGTVINPDFGVDELKMLNSLSPLHMLASVAVKLYECEHPFKPTVNVPNFERKMLPFNLNVKPRTYRKPRSSPIDINALIPCLNKKRKRDDGDKNNSVELGFDRTKKLRLVVRLQPPKLAEDYEHKILKLGGSNPRFVIERRLRKSDVSNRNGSFLKMPFVNCLTDFSEIGEMQVTVYHQVADNFNAKVMRFKRSCSESAYVFSGSWNDIVQANELKVGETVQVWSFRQHCTLSFALIKL